MRNSAFGLSRVARAAALAAVVSAFSASAAGAEPLKLRLDWSWWIGQVPFLVAAEKGYYKDAGLEVEIEQGQGSKTTTVLVGDGSDPLGHVNLSTAAQSIASGVPIKAVAAIIQKGPIGLICDAALGIKTPEDIKGKKIGSTPSGSDAQILPAFLAANGLTDQATIVNMQGDAKFAAIMAGQVDCISGDGPYYAPQMDAKGKPASIMLYADWGVPNLAFGIIANDTFIKEHPEEVKKFVEASLKGVEYTYANIDEAVNLFIEKTGNTQPKSFHKGVLEFYKTQLHTAASEGKPLGWMSEEDWTGMLKGLGDKSGKPVSDYYTNEFVD